jgi:pentatricopeptide repeat domain-containing protein 1
MTFDEMLRRRLRPNRRTYNNLIRSCRRAGDFDRAFAIFEEMKREGIAPDVVSYNLLCATCADRINFIRGRPTATSVGSGSAGGSPMASSSGAAVVPAAPPVRRTKEQIEVGLRALAQLALSLLAEMEAAQVEPNTYTFHAVLGILSDCCDARLFDVLQHMREVRDAQCEREATRVPHPVEAMSARPLTDGQMPTFTELDAMIDAATQRALLSSGAGGGEGMGAHGVEVTAEAYGLAIEGAGRLRAIQKANALLEQMRQEGVAPTRDTYVRALRVCALDADKVTAFRHLDAAGSQGLVIDIALYNALLAVLTARSDPQASEVFAEIKHDRRRVGVKPNEETYLLLLRSLLQQGDEARAMEVYRDMCLPSSPVTPTHAVFEVLLDMCAVSGNLQLANQLMLDATKRRGLAPTASLYAHFMTVYLKANDPAVIDIFATLKRSGPAPDLEVYRVMLRYYAANMNEAILPLFDEMKRAGIDPDLDAYNTMMLFAAQQAAPQRAFRLLEELKVRGMHADIHTYNALLTVFAPTGSDFIFKIFEEMAECKVAPDQNSFAILLRHRAGRQALQRAQEQRMVKVAFASDELGLV